MRTAPARRWMNRPAQPDFTVVVATRSRPDALASCLEALAALDYPAPLFEVVVVDDGGRSPAAPVVSRFAGRLAVTLLEQEHGGPSAARNLGAAHGRGRFVAFADDDCEPARGWLSAFREALGQAPEALVGGRIVNAAPGAALREGTELLVEYVSRRSRAPFPTGNNAAASADAFAAVGGFDAENMPGMADDRALADRWRASGRPIGWAPDAVALHGHAGGLRAFVLQHLGYGRGAVCLRRARLRAGNARGALPEPLSFYAGLVRYPIVRRPGIRGWVLAGVVLFAQAVTAVGAAAELVRPTHRPAQEER